MKFSVIIPTYKRTEALVVTVESVVKNSLLPSSLIIIDDDVTLPETLNYLEKIVTEKNIEFIYHKKDHNVIRRGLSESKNLAVSLVTDEVICYLDDDVVLDVEYFNKLMQTWSYYSHETMLIGMGGKISNNRKTTRLEKKYRNFFGLNGEYNWDVNRVGFQSWNQKVTSTEKGYYIHGGVSSYRRELLKQFPFEVFSGGRTGLEDVEHCLRVKRAGYHFYYVPSAHLTHHPSSSGREVQFVSGKKESQNRLEIFKKHCSQTIGNKLYFIWANVGWIGKKVLSGNWRYALGMVVGYVSSKK